MNNSGLTTVTIKGEDIKIRFGIPAVRMFLEKLGDDSSIMKNDVINEQGIAYLLYSGYVNNCMVDDEPPIKKFGFFLEYVEDGFVDDEINKKLKEVAECYANSKYKKSIVDRANETLSEVKKKRKQTGTK
jgi:hypothetical protein